MSNSEFRFMLQNWPRLSSTLRIFMAIIPLLIGALLILFTKFDELGTGFAAVGLFFLVLYRINAWIEMKNKS